MTSLNAPSASDHSINSTNSSDGTDSERAAPAATGVVTYGSPPTEIRNLTVEAGDGMATVLWEPPADTGGLALQSYELHLEPFGWHYQAGAGGTGRQGCAVTGLISATTYTVSVSARNARGQGPVTSASFTPQRIPDPAASPPGGGDSSSGAPTEPTSSVKPTTATSKKPTVRLSAGTQRRGHRVTVRWKARHAGHVRLTWRRGQGEVHSQRSAASGRITLAGPPGTRYIIGVRAGNVTDQRSYRIR